MAQCGGNCSACGGCGKELVLSMAEIDFLNILGQIPFLPVARRADDMTPVYLEDPARSKEEWSLILQVLAKKGLITLDYGQPLKGFDMSAYTGYPVHGSIALTQRGQTVVDLLDMQGISKV